MTTVDTVVWWQPQDATALVQARNSTEMTRADFARALSISEKQLIQLEEGGVSAFYSERIKYQVGQRILGYFGIQTTAESIGADDNVEKHEGQRQDAEGFQIRNGYVLIAALVLVGCLVSAYFPDLETRNPVSLSPVAPPASTQIAAASAEEAASAPDMAASASTGDIPAAELMTCDWSGVALALKPVGATRPTDRILLVASADISLCLKDGSGQEQRMSLKAGDRETVYGSGAPWLIYSPTLSTLKVFYQGFSVLTPKDDTSLIKVEARL